MPTTPNEIEITYSKQPQGQVGTRPRRIPRNAEFHFTTKDPGDLSIEFTGDSPLADGSKKVKANTAVKAAKPGRYPFLCTLEHNGVKRTLGIASDPSSGVGGELEVPPDPAD